MVAINKWLLFIKILFYLRDDCISAIFYVNRFEDDLINFINMYSCTRHNLSSNTCFYKLYVHILTITMVDIIGKITIYGLICSLFISFYRDKRLNTFVFQEREDIDLFILECWLFLTLCYIKSLKSKISKVYFYWNSTVSQNEILIHVFQTTWKQDV